MHYLYWGLWNLDFYRFCGGGWSFNQNKKIVFEGGDHGRVMESNSQQIRDLNSIGISATDN